MSGLSSYLLSTLSRVGGLGGGGGGGSVPDFPFALGERLDGCDGGLWELRQAQQQQQQQADGGQDATVFVFDKTRGADCTAAAQNAVRRMRALRHPGIVRFLAAAETADAIYIATEPVEPLARALERDRPPEDLARWGLFRAAEALAFVNADCGLVHANVAAASVLVTRAGEWRLGGFELTDALDCADGAQPLYRRHAAAIPGYAARMAPEMAAAAPAPRCDRPAALDGWGLGCLIHDVYNGAAQAPSDGGRAQTRGRIPADLWPLARRLCAPDPRQRATPAEFLRAGQQAPGAPLDSGFVRACRFIEHMAVKDDAERAEFLAGLDAALAGFPRDFTKHKLLPELLKLVEFGGGASGSGASALRTIVQISNDALDAAERSALVAPAFVRLFASNDRALRFVLLEHMASLVRAIPQPLVASKVFPSFAAGFLDAAPAIREATVKAALAIAPCLGQKTLNGDLVRQLVRLVADPEPGIRTNALVCIGRLCTAKPSSGGGGGGGGSGDPAAPDAPPDGMVSESSHRYVVCPALVHALRDQFPPVRSTALAVIAACAPRWDPPDVARRVIPSVSPLLVDGERPVRAAALKAVRAMVACVEAHAQTMPDSQAKRPATTTASSNSTSTSSPAAHADPAAAIPGSPDRWGGWAVSSLSSTITGALSLASSLPIGQATTTPPATVTTAAAASVAPAPRANSEPNPKPAPEPLKSALVQPLNDNNINNDDDDDDDDFAENDGWGDDDGWGLEDVVLDEPPKPAIPAPLPPPPRPPAKLGAMKLGGHAKKDPLSLL
ncbi:Nuclear aminoacylation-dependent tRNA export pathway component [Coemansia javaensis]|uniref:Nuclear aminoacylation-dependent tRNA export pathway component n=1 Tax=Coemansia javaensis TaxID=2761396 RepID=A0A9W8LKA9_9FUNG|nr:Nuclear aminoacylation-dependent tRNA export pathway component [Coemansia javaensis]